MKKFLLLFLSFFIGVGLLVWVIDFVGWQEIKNAFLVFTGLKGIIILVLTFLMLILGNLKWQEILKSEEVEVSFWSLFKPFLAGFSIMFLTPVLIGLGEVFRAYGVKRKAQISWSKATASVLIDRIFEWFVNLVVIYFGILIFLYKIAFPFKYIVIISITLLLFFIFVISAFYSKSFKKESIIKTFGRIFSGRLDKEPLDVEKEIFNFFKVQNKSMWKSLGFSFLRGGMMYLRTWFLIIFLGREISLLSSLSVLGFTYLTAMIPIPTSLGSHEAIQTFAFKSLGLEASLATAFTMIIRAAELLFALAGIVILINIGVTFLRDIFFKGIEKFSRFKDSL